MVDWWIIGIVSTMSYIMGYWFCYLMRPKTVGSILINDTDDFEGPFLLLELDDSVESLSDLKTVVVRVIKQK